MPASGPILLVAVLSALAPLGEAGSQEPDLRAELDRLVDEGKSGSRLQDGVLLVRTGDGWVRTRRILSNFEFTAEVRLLSPKTELSIGLRAISTSSEWPRRGYRLRLSSKRPAAVVAAGYRLTDRTTGSMIPEVGSWHRIKVAAKGSQIEVWMDERPVGTYDVDLGAGSLVFQSKGYDAEVRRISFDSQTAPRDLLFTEYKKRGDASFPRLVKEVKPDFPEKLSKYQIEGAVHLEALVLTDGAVSGVWLTKLLHPDLEHAALNALRKWRFDPARLNGSPVPMLIEVEMSFTNK